MASRKPVLMILLAVMCAVSPGKASTIVGITTLNGFMHYAGDLQVTLDQSSPEFTSSLDANNFGSFGWTWVNNTGGTIGAVRIDLFLDAFVDDNEFNELGDFVSLSLSALAPAGAIAPVQWEIDEPSYLCGDIYFNATSASGALDGQNYVPCAATPQPDDVSLALQFDLPDLNPGDTLNLTGSITQEAVGLLQTDIDTNDSFHLTAFAQVNSTASTPAPEPGTLLMAGCGLALLGIRRVRR